MQISHLLLIGNGEEVSPRLVKKLSQQADYILAADGGADKALHAGITPDGIIGDLDSVSMRIKKQLAKQLISVFTQENTDLEKALRWAVKHHFSRITLVGFLGGRWDFSIGNLLALAKWANKIDIALAGDHWRIVPLVKTTSFGCKPHKRVSLIPLTTCSDVTVTGMAYPLTHARLTLGITRTLSNQTMGSEFSVGLKRGALLVYYEV